MKTTVQIFLKSGNVTTVNNLISINTKGSDRQITNFKEFHLSVGASLTFVGETTSVSLFSNEIEYVVFSVTGQ